MKIFVKSRGHEQDYDYKWKDIKGCKAPSDFPVKKFENLIDSKAFSLLLARDEELMFLLVSGVASSRRDYQKRVIRNSVVWILNNNEDERLLRALAIMVLQSFQSGRKSFSQEIDTSIVFDVNKEDFKIQEENCKILSEVDLQAEASSENPLGEQLESKYPSNMSRIERIQYHDSQIDIDDRQVARLIEDLRKYKLPERKSELVIVTKNKSLEGFNMLWRGLSAITIEKKEWNTLRNSEGVIGSEKKSMLMITIAAVTLLSILLLLSLLTGWLRFGNYSPVISGTSQTTTDAGVPYLFSPKAEDKDGDNLEFSIKNKPNWATFDQKTGSLSGTPNPDDVGTVSDIVISVTDGEKTVDLPAFDLIVTPPTSINVNQTYNFTPVVKDLNSQNLVFSIENKPSWATFDQKTGRLSGTPNPDDVGTAPDIVISVTDGEETVNLPPFNLTVNESKP